MSNHQNIKEGADQMFTAGEWRILITKRITQAWKDICKDQQSLVHSGSAGFRLLQMDQNIMRLISEDWAITVHQV